MACGKPPNPDRITTPSPLSHPTSHPTASALIAAEKLIEMNGLGKEVDEAISRAERLLETAIMAGLDPRIRERLEGRLQHLKGFAQSRMRDSVMSSPPDRRVGTKAPSVSWVLKHFSEDSARRNAPTVIRALENDKHWRCKEFRTELIKLIEGNARIPREYKEQLPLDVAEVLRVCPSAAGIVKAMTLRGQHAPLLSRSKLGSDANAAIGSAYELMGTAAIIRQSSKATNGGPKLYIDPHFDHVAFGAKSTMNRQVNKLGLIEMPTRRTIESDVQIGRKTSDGYREIGIDFKHGEEARPRYASEDLKNQVENVSRAIRHGQLHEYHFVTNTTFGTSFREVIEAANGSLDRKAISLHEHVTSIPPRLL